MKRLYAEINKYDCISFDIFDTLLVRNIGHPTNVFRAVQYLYNTRYCDSGIEDFAKIRIQSEKLAREKKKTEITLDDIYNEISNRFCLETVAKYKNLEIEVELSVAKPNLKIKELFEYCIKNNKRIILVSDMYLPQKIIEQLLEINDIKRYHKIYLSSEIGFTKAKGTIYSYILGCEKKDAHKILHIGDNFKSDIVNAQKYGFKTYLIKKRHNQNYDKQSGDIQQIAEMSLNNFLYRSFSYKDTYGYMGYSCLGPMLYGFVSWLYKEFQKNTIEEILFFSRDGYIMKRAYEKEYPFDHRCKYFYASRRALQVAAIWINPEYEEVIGSMFLKRKMMLASVIRTWGIDAEAYRNTAKSFGLELEEIIDGTRLLENKKIKKFYNYIKTDIINNSKIECKAFLQYLSDNDCRGNIAIVDIGWYGNMQKAFEKIVHTVGLDINVYGYYLGVVPDSKNQKNQYMRGYLFQAGKNKDLFNMERNFGSMLELFFMAPHGSTQKYSLQSDCVVIELGNFEYVGTETLKNIQYLQNAAFQFIEEYHNLGKCIVNDEIMYSKNIIENLVNPKYTMANELGELQMADDNMLFCMAKPKRLLFYVFHPKQFKDDFLFASWKTGFCKRLFIIPFPYFELITFLRSRVKITKWLKTAN